MFKYHPNKKVFNNLISVKSVDSFKTKLMIINVKMFYSKIITKNQRSDNKSLKLRLVICYNL